MVKRVAMLETLPTDLAPMNQFFLFLGTCPKVVWERQEGG
jgi:hypothetical protein